MSTRPLLGTRDWHEVSVVLDVPTNALGIAFGVLLTDPGDLLVDDLRLEIAPDAALTNQLTGPTPAGVDSATIAATYARAPVTPVNLDFEGIPSSAPSAATVEWLGRTAVAFATSQPGSSDADLESLREMIGSARMVGMGEGTHGTREFFQLKHRVFQFLVRQMGFTHFGIEATWPEANNLNDYVLTGQGDPARLLSNLYFWTWNTQEVMDLIAWMRQWNLAAPPERRVQFLGFDMQFPGAAMDTVTSFVARVDSASAPFVYQRFACLNPYRNIGSSGPFTSNYAGLPAATRAACRDAVEEVFNLIRQRQSDYQSASSVAAYNNVRQSARLVQQFEAVAGRTGSRDAFMAENAQWLLDQAGQGARMMLWAHNGHVSRLPGAMGDVLERVYGDDYVNLGFLFGRGDFNAVGSNGLRAWNAQLVLDQSMEAYFTATTQPRLLFDARRIAAGGSVAALLSGPIRMRSIGAVFEPSAEAQYFTSHIFPGDFDLLMYVAQTSASIRLPFVR
jgi:erythromycin esterase